MVAIPESARPILDFTIQIIVGSIGFLVVFGAAVIISLVVHACDGIIPDWMTETAEIAEKGLMGLDLICFGLFVLAEAVKLIRGMWSEAYGRKEIERQAL